MRSGRKSQFHARTSGSICSSAESHKSGGRKRLANLASPRAAARRHRRSRRIHVRTLHSVERGTTCSIAVTTGGGNGGEGGSKGSV